MVAASVSQIWSLKSILLIFEAVSGLKTNMTKTTLIDVGGADSMEDLASIFGMQNFYFTLHRFGKLSFVDRVFSHHPGTLVLQLHTCVLKAPHFRDEITSNVGNVSQVSFAVDGVLLLSSLSLVKAFLEVVCTVGGTVFTAILLLRLIWATLSHFQSNGNRFNQGGNSYGAPQPVT
ncbi:hypothetical protein IFM89_013352 [Coptis chinensis]|uniref:Uncharacterized protein n=1 Tax=Coptis chinensis TaxID=261450 RepID=A0A835LUW3_9MAGN|nr:hypothetical protein IFM89_013352 [Coptis chinensis]